ncbi:MAG: acyl-CoA desaturase [Aphanocapsa feldmannii 277cV]|uniref:Acyl-CoA desaturase n=2 Tax=Aphanocapsa feldmannii TaxID=192050 RepID=A0A524RRU8_9CHRO|nr:MAG: acyl-CoA desaturase [Aphanocapsa feldmannii 288cV]TGG96635.1 MAG: acyl-CoA desaturase [Aphanocapsa feldmannii 277cV]TGH21198.1 MAG: acyl-CoA desaturase [Aphanocapsa feldmannii 277cI]
MSESPVAESQQARASVKKLIGAPRAPLTAGTHPWSAGTVGFMLAMHVGAVAALLPFNWSWPAVAVLAVLYWATVIGVTLGYHRMVAHRSFKGPRWLERLMMVMGTLSVQSGPIEWVGLHRHHHRFSDQPNDHHDAARGLWWSHSEWMLHKIPAVAEVERYAGDLLADPFYCWLERWFLLLQVPLAFALYWLGEALAVPGGGWALVLWGVPLRMVIVYHVTWLVNSATHAFGYRNFDCPDLSTNCWWVAILAFGEGWHNNHHAFPQSARHGLRWFEFDITWQHIRFLRRIGLIHHLRIARFPAR